MRRSVMALVILALCPVHAGASSPSNDVFVAAAFRGTGAGSSQWSSRLVLFNPGSQDATARIYWLERDRPNPTPLQAPPLSVPAGSSVSIDDAILALFGVESGGGAFRVTSDQPLVVDSAIFNTDADGRRFGQGFPGLGRNTAIQAGERTTTDVGGVDLNDLERANFYGLAIDDGSTSVTVDVLAADGASILASQTLQLGHFQPFLVSLSTLGLAPPLSGLIVRFSVTSGTIVGAGVSVINNLSGDPITRNGWWPEGVELEGDGYWVGFVDLTFDGGLRFLVRDGHIVEVQGSLVALSPEDGGLDCSDVFEHGAILATPVALPADGGPLQISYSTQVDESTRLDITIAGTRFGSTLQGAFETNVVTTSEDRCRGELRSASFTVAATSMAPDTTAKATPGHLTTHASPFRAGLR